MYAYCSTWTPSDHSRTYLSSPGPRERPHLRHTSSDADPRPTPQNPHTCGHGTERSPHLGHFGAGPEREMKFNPHTGQRSMGGGAIHTDERHDGQRPMLSDAFPPFTVHLCPQTLHWTWTVFLSHTVLLHAGHLCGRFSPPIHTFPHTRQVRLTGRGASHLVLLHSGHL